MKSRPEDTLCEDCGQVCLGEELRRFTLSKNKLICAVLFVLLLYCEIESQVAEASPDQEFIIPLLLLLPSSAGVTGCATMLGYVVLGTQSTLGFVPARQARHQLSHPTQPPQDTLELN